MTEITESLACSFGQYDPKGDIVLCPGLPPRIYESLKTLCCLAAAETSLQAHEIAAATDLPPAQTAKILQQMAWAGLVESRRGTKGGYWLLKPAASIRVTDVVEFFSSPTEDRTHKKKDPLLRALERATQRCRKELRRITVADLAKFSSCKRPSRKRTTGNPKKESVAGRTGQPGVVH